jgi:hypothetical protein
MHDENKRQSTIDAYFSTWRLEGCKGAYLLQASFLSSQGCFIALHKFLPQQYEHPDHSSDTHEVLVTVQSGNRDIAFIRKVLMRAKWSVITSFYCIIIP